jgi:ATP/maltotriose-dependent transcriptional regulator MalT
MPKSKWNLNTIYISERLQESLRPISRCAMTTVVAPMGYGKTTAVEWYLAERAGAEAPYIVRISVYSSNLAIFWKSVQDAFARAGIAFLREYDCPTDGASGGLLIDDLCHTLTEREYEIVRLMAQRLNNREIAEKLYLSEGSIRQYVNQIYTKLQIAGEPRAKRKLLLDLLADKN